MFLLVVYLWLKMEFLIHHYCKGGVENFPISSKKSKFTEVPSDTRASGKWINWTTIQDFCLFRFLTLADTARLDIIITLVPSDLTLPLQLGSQLQLACNIYTDPAIDLSSTGWLYNDQPFYLFNNHKYVVYNTPASGKSNLSLKDWNYF